MNFGGTRSWIATRQHLHSTAPHQLGVMSFRLGIYIYSLGLLSRHPWWFWTRCIHNYAAQKTAPYRFGQSLNSVLFSEYWHIRCIRGFSDYVLHRFTIYITLLGSLEAGWAGTYPLAWGTWLGTNLIHDFTPWHFPWNWPSSVKNAHFREIPWSPWFFVNFNAFTFIYEGFQSFISSFCADFAVC